jgi:hypothetical protein
LGGLIVPATDPPPTIQGGSVRWHTVNAEIANRVVPSRFPSTEVRQRTYGDALRGHNRDKDGQSLEKAAMAKCNARGDD